MGKTILIVEDEQNIVDILSFNLSREGYDTLEAYDGKTGLQLALEQNPDLILLDLMLPEMNGFDVCRKLREAGSSVPILMLTAREEETDKVLGLELGADDYMTKPFNPLEVIARINSNLRRYYELSGEQKENASKLRNGELTLDMDRMSASIAGRELSLTPTEFKILSLFMKNPGRVFTKAQICEAVNGEYYEADENTIIVHISKLREKMNDDSKNPEYIRNIRGLGYKIEKK